MTDTTVAVNLRAALARLEPLAVRPGALLPADLGPLEYLLLYGVSGDPQRFTGFVGIG